MLNHEIDTKGNRRIHKSRPALSTGKVPIRAQITGREGSDVPGN
jgi:hypothetical protein